MEKGLHDFEEFYSSCSIKRGFDPKKAVCPVYDCSDLDAADVEGKKLATLKCDEDCSKPECIKAFMNVVAVRQPHGPSVARRCTDNPLLSCPRFIPVHCAAAHA